LQASKPTAGGRHVSICSDLCNSNIGLSDFCNNMFCSVSC
jgi:hypothetical protein